MSRRRHRQPLPALRNPLSDAMADLPRLLDANANRAREAMRVLEDAARFLIDHADLARQCKQLRHDLAAALRSLPGHVAPEIHRDTPGDVGTTITTPAESDRRTERDVVIAAGKRLSEALRCIEEYGKLIDPDFAARIEALRYRGYTIESQLHKLIGSDRVRQWHLCVLLSESLCTGRPWDEVVAGAIAGGADCIQVREKTLPDGELLRRVEHVIELARAARHAVSVIVNDRADIALAAGADGVHLGQDDLPPDRVRQIVGRALCIGVSTHNLTEAKRAVRAGSDYCGVGAMFTTSTKPRRTSGIAYLQRFLSKYPHLPHLAIGGIHAGNAVEVLEAGAQGLAVSSTICGADDPARETRRLVRLIERHVRSES